MRSSTPRMEADGYEGRSGASLDWLAIDRLAGASAVADAATGVGAMAAAGGAGVFGGAATGGGAGVGSAATGGGAGVGSAAMGGSAPGVGGATCIAGATGGGVEER